MTLNPDEAIPIVNAPTADPRYGPPELEEDESVAPRPEEEIADIARASPDTSDHSAP